MNERFDQPMEKRDPSSTSTFSPLVQQQEKKLFHRVPTSNSSLFFRLTVCSPSLSFCHEFSPSFQLPFSLSLYFSFLKERKKRLPHVASQDLKLQ